MPELLSNAMDITFVDERDNFVVIYLDDILVFSKSESAHLKHFRIVFNKCRKFRVSLNMNNSHFTMKEGKPLVHNIKGGHPY